MAALAHVSDRVVVLEAELEHAKVELAKRERDVAREVRERVEASREFAEHQRLEACAELARVAWVGVRCTRSDGCIGKELHSVWGCRCWQRVDKRTAVGRESWDHYERCDAEERRAYRVVEGVRDAIAGPLTVELKEAAASVRALEDALQKARSALQKCKNAEERRFYETASVAVLEERLAQWIEKLEHKAKALELMVWVLGGDDKLHVECHCSDPNECYCADEVDVSHEVRAHLPNVMALAHFTPLYEEADAEAYAAWEATREDEDGEE